MILFTDIKLTTVALVLAIAATVGAEAMGNSVTPKLVKLNSILELAK